jgi:two-component system chemotaxis response regulator CheY
MKILLVEDNSEMRRLIKSMITEIADEIFEAGDGAAAVEFYRTVLPDWVLMDIFMKPVDGLTAATAIKIADSGAKIVFVSNHTDKRTRQAARNAGGTAFFGKDDLLGLLEFLKNEKLKI